MTVSETRLFWMMQFIRGEISHLGIVYMPFQHFYTMGKNLNWSIIISVILMVILYKSLNLHSSHLSRQALITNIHFTDRYKLFASISNIVLMFSETVALVISMFLRIVFLLFL